jgi:5-hydroxyisourate hydrolase
MAWATGGGLSGISTHVLDTAAGKPGTVILVELEILEADGWRLLSTQETDQDGRCRQLLPLSTSLKEGRYRLRFHTDAYYKAHALEGLYPLVEIMFVVRDANAHMHIPLLLTANGYTTYRGT